MQWPNRPHPAYDSLMARQDTDPLDQSSFAFDDFPSDVKPALTPFAAALARIADFVMPPVCLGCHAHLGGLDALCPKCWSGITFIRPPLCDRLGTPMPYDTGGVMISAAAYAAPPSFDRARAVANFDGLMRDLVHDLKFNDRHDLRRLLCRWLLEAGREVLAGADIVVPVPLGRWRLFQRGFNQAALLAKDIAEKTTVTYAPMVLVRTRKTRPQVGLTRLERQKNVRGAFAVPDARKNAVAGRNIVLIDDVITTGATVGACARALKRAGAARVDVLSLALVTDAGLVTV
jgi:ComF family protein